MKLAFFLCASAMAAAAMPLDLPRELMADVNKDSALLNIIAEPSSTAEAAQILTSTRRSFFKAPLQVKVAQSTKVHASPALLSAIHGEISSSMRKELNYFLQQLSRAKSSFVQSRSSFVDPVMMKNSQNLTCWACGQWNLSILGIIE